MKRLLIGILLVLLAIPIVAIAILRFAAFEWDLTPHRALVNRLASGAAF